MTACWIWHAWTVCIDSTVKLFAFTHVSNTLGTVNPVADLCARARKRGIVTLVDAAQSAGHRAGGRAGDRLRFPRVFRPQNLRADRHRRALRTARIA